MSAVNCSRSGASEFACSCCASAAASSSAACFSSATAAASLLRIPVRLLESLLRASSAGAASAASSYRLSCSRFPSNSSRLLSSCSIFAFASSQADSALFTDSAADLIALFCRSFSLVELNSSSAVFFLSAQELSSSSIRAAYSSQSHSGYFSPTVSNVRFISALHASEARSACFPAVFSQDCTTSA